MLDLIFYISCITSVLAMGYTICNNLTLYQRNKIRDRAGRNGIRGSTNGVEYNSHLLALFFFRNPYKKYPHQVSRLMKD